MRLHRRMRHVVIQIGGVEERVRFLRAFLEVTILCHHGSFRSDLEQMVEDGFLVKARLRHFIFRFAHRQGAFRLVGIGVQEGNEIPIPYDLNSLHPLRVGEVHLDQSRAVSRRTQNLCVEHAGELNVRRTFRLARHFVPGVFSQNRLAHDLEIRGLLCGSLARHVAFNSFALG